MADMLFLSLVYPKANHMSLKYTYVKQIFQFCPKSTLPQYILHTQWGGANKILGANIIWDQSLHAAKISGRSEAVALSPSASLGQPLDANYIHLLHSNLLEAKELSEISLSSFHAGG